MEGVAVCATLVGILFVSFSGVCHGQINISINPSTDIKQGDQVTVTCTAENLSIMDFIRFARIVDGSQYPIADALDIESVFQKTGRYSVELVGSKSAVLTIVDIQGEDSGSIACVKMNEGATSFETITVAVPPKSATLMTVEAGIMVPLDGDRPIEFSESRSAGIACEVEIDGSKAAPEISIKIDGEDITSSFSKTESPSEENNHGLVYLNNIVTLTMETDEPNIDYNGKTITCEAKMPEFDHVIDSADIRVTYGPRAECSGTEFAKVGQVDVKLTCQVKMYPSMDRQEDASWSWGPKGNRTKITSESSVDGFAFTMGEPEGDATDFTLTIAEVSEDHFRTYRLDVTNSINSMRFAIDLEKAQDVTTTTTTTTTTQKPRKPSTPDSGPLGAASALQVHLMLSVAAVFLSLVAGRL